MSNDKITYETIIARVREKLGCGSDRISDAPAALRWIWWPNAPDFKDELLSNYGLKTKFGVLEKEFREEIQAIRETLDELGYEPGLADWQKSSIEAGRKMMASLNQVATALNIWDQIGVPIRRKGEIVFRIWAPKDVMGSPIIKALPVDLFINSVANETISYRIEIERVKKTMDRWRLVAIILGAIIGVRILAWVM